MLSYLQDKHNTIMGLYQDHYTSVTSLQTYLHDQVLPQLICELDLNEPAVQQAQEWIADKGSIFRTFKKHKYNVNDTRLVLERTLRWRISYLAPLLQDAKDDVAKANIDGNSHGPRKFIHCLPAHVRDLCGQPVFLLRLGLLVDASDETKNEIIKFHEEMRRRLYFCERKNDAITLQCVAIVDSKDASIRSVAIQLVSWFIREVTPRFPGMCAAVFVMNHSWSYGVYNIIKRLLPASVLARIHFPTDTELLTCFDRQDLPEEYKGLLPLALSSDTDTSLSISTGSPPPPPSPPTTMDVDDAKFKVLLPSMTMSSLNPYFGYPVVANPSSSVLHLKNGRQRKRDLARTLAKLWLVKLKRLTDKTWLWIILTVVLWALGLRDP